MSKSNVVLVDPPAFGSDEKKKLNGHLYSFALCSIAAVLRDNGHNVSIIDSVALLYSYDELLDEILAQNPKYVGLTAMTHTINSAALVAKKLKEIRNDIFIILGGVHVTSATEETISRYANEFDIAVIGEGEITIVELIDALEQGANIENVDGIAFHKTDEIIITRPRQFIPDLTSLPLPAWDLLPDMRKYYRPSLISAGNRYSSHLLTSRGCPGKCLFCDTSVNGRRIRGYSAEYVLNMIDILTNHYGIEDIQFNDDTFVSLKKRLLEICDLLIAKQYKLTWSCDARADGVNLEILKRMKAAGCWQIAFGVETGSQRIMDFLKKGVTFDQVKNACRWAKEAGISTKGFFIIGHPTETQQSLNETIELMLSLQLDVVGITFFTAFPGSPIYSSIANYGNFDPDWESVNTYEIGNFIPDGFNSSELVKFRKQSLARFYFRPKQLITHIRNIENPYQLLRLAHGGLKVLSNFV